MRSIAYTSEKGGVFKTGGTTIHSILLTTTLASTGKRVLVFDMDPQAHTSNLLGHPREQHVGPTIKEVILDNVPLQDVVVSTRIDPQTAQFVDSSFQGDVVPGPDLVPITLAANTLDFDMKSKLDYWPERMGEILETVKDEYSYVLFDCPPGLLAPTMSVYAAVDFLVFPVTPDKLGVEGLQGAIGAMQRTQKRNKNLQAAGAFFTRVHNWRTDKSIMEQVSMLIQQSGLDIPLLQNSIPESKDYNEAITDDGSLVVLSRPDTKCAKACWYVLDELLDRVGGPAQPLVHNVVAQMKQQDQQVEEERRLSRKTARKGA